MRVSEREKESRKGARVSGHTLLDLVCVGVSVESGLVRCAFDGKKGCVGGWLCAQKRKESGADVEVR